MSRPRILVTRKLPADVEARALSHFAATLNPDDRASAREHILANAQGKDGLLVTVTDRIDAALIAALPASIRIISTFSVGYDHIDVAAAQARGIAVTNTPDVLTDATAEIALASASVSWALAASDVQPHIVPAPSAWKSTTTTAIACRRSLKRAHVITLILLLFSVRRMCSPSTAPRHRTRGASSTARPSPPCLTAPFW
ncbi:MAG: hypothetical protein CVT81_03060 [Alphaproteobacteria bacterium HGW-Alphaproteobacteria-3]|nr:MAG: hypothetical protein CVT81_03060 [Alphaproteobacteria bacterium HGW-Alphaproteobacteria-3]